MNKRLIVSVLLIGLMALSMSGCKKWFGKKSSTTEGAAGTTEFMPPGGAGGGEGLGSRTGFEGTNMAGQFDTVLFAYDSAQVQDTERTKAEAVATFMKGNANTVVLLEGNCDERGSVEYNMSLGERRALSVRAYLMNLGIDGARIQTKSLGKEQPKDPGHSEEAWRVNRRVEFVVLKN
jgi:peptidoglycan-associated lipoprotein